MRKLVLCAALMVSGLSFAATPTEQSIRELLDITETKSMVDQSMGQMDQYIKSGMQAALEGKEVTPEMQQDMDDTAQKLAKVLQQEFKWESFEPAFVDIYRKSFSQSDIDGMLQFYKTEAGQSVIKKMPIVMQHSMQVMQQRMQQAMPKIMAAMDEVTADIQEESANEAATQ